MTLLDATVTLEPIVCRSTSGDHLLFSVDTDGEISSNGALDYDTQQTYSFDLNYLASDGRTFTESIALTLTDTLTSTATITTEETESLTIPIAQLTSSNSYQQKSQAAHSVCLALMPAILM